jgi:hypothetical protein
MKWLIGTTLAAILLPGIAIGEDDDDGNDNGQNGWSGWYGATSDWSRGRGYWGGSWDGRYPGYSPFNWNDDDSWNYSNYSRPAAVRLSGYVRTDPRIPGGFELLELDHRSLRHMMHTSVMDFDRWLHGIPGGEVWRKHFETRAILELGAPHEDAALTTAERDTIVRVLGVYDQAVEDPDLRTITRADSFHAAHVALRELATPADERLVRQLSSSARNLNRSLAGISTGAKWQRYLALPDEIIAAADKPPGATQPDRRFDADELARILERYDRVSRNPEYRGIAALPPFQVTHERLIALLNHGDEAQDESSPVPTGTLPPPPPPEQNGAK